MATDDKLIQKMEGLLSVISEADGFGKNGGELSADDLDKVFGGVTVPEFGQFLQYVRERDAKDGEK